MKTTTRWTTAVLFLLTLMLAGCGSGLQLPPIVIAPAPKPIEKPVERPKATLAFQIVDEQFQQPIATAFATIQNRSGQAPNEVWVPRQRQANADGYVDFVLETGRIYEVVFEADEYEDKTQKFQLEGNRQFPIWLKSTKPAPPPVTPPPPPAPPIVSPPPVVTPVPPVSKLCAMRESDPLGCLRQVAAVYPGLLQTNTFESCVEFTQRVLEVLGPDWGHVGKTNRDGGQTRPRGFVELDAIGSDGQTYRITGVSHDAIKHRTSGQVVDILGNATANEPCPTDIAKRGECWKPGPASIDWNLVPREHWREYNPFVPAVPVR